MRNDFIMENMNMESSDEISFFNQVVIIFMDLKLGHQFPKSTLGPELGSVGSHLTLYCDI